ncbi:MAG: M50 family metallopeptidase [Candidatus Nanoarchaeia archaeon]|nr:M50 family metallopeptidase [Candidatus Nanoarchaeia archaeon]
MFFTIKEIFEIVIVTIFVGIIFMGLFKKRNSFVYASGTGFIGLFDKSAFIKSILVFGPAIILHELGHKFMAMAFGSSAYFNAAYQFLFLALLLRLIGLNFFFIIPAYVSFPIMGLNNLQMSLIAFAGPLVNLILFLIAMIILRKPKKYYMMIFKEYNDKKYNDFLEVLNITKKINLLLFGLNMLPIPPLDGFSVFSNIFKFLF